MSELLEIQKSIVADRESVFSDNVTNLRTGQDFRAEIQAISDLELMTELGADPRASHWFYVRDNNADIQANDRLTAIGATFQILPKFAPSNAASPQRKFLAMQLTDKDA